MEHAAEMVEAARFLDRAIGHIANLRNTQAVRVLDFGCGAGHLMPIFYSWRERSWRKPLILLELRGRFCENVVPRL
jgi:hypothetical protein